ncbi:MAG: SDR family NAD(P)-dependent oxidoreductase [Nannocystaceae bacterium]
MTKRRRPPRTPAEFTDRYGPWAIVLGASEGLGAAFAGELARRGLNLLLVARRAEVLEEVAAPLRSRVEVRCAALDLADAALAERLASLTADLDLGLCVYNAAYSRIGPFVDQSLADKERILAVNCRGPLIAAHVFGPRMIARGRGGLLLMSSLTAFWGAPWIATYGATKAFNLMLGEALWGELGARGVDVLSCCAGATRTPGFLRASAGGSAPRSMPAESVAAAALDRLGGGPSMIPGIPNRLAALALRILPRRRAVTILGDASAGLRDGDG